MDQEITYVQDPSEVGEPGIYFAYRSTKVYTPTEFGDLTTADLEREVGLTITELRSFLAAVDVPWAFENPGGQLADMSYIVDDYFYCKPWYDEVENIAVMVAVFFKVEEK